MARPVRLRSSSHLQETVQDYQTVFIMFYSTRNASVQGFTPIYNSLCARYSAPSVAFTKIPKEDFPELRNECGVPQDSVLDLVIFKRGSNVEVAEIKDSIALERYIVRYAQPSPRFEAQLEPCCDCRECRKPQCGSSLLRSPERRAPKPRQVSVPAASVPVRIDPGSAIRLGPNQTVPANMTYSHFHRGRVHEHPAQLVYRGSDGRPRRARSVHITRDGNGPPETTYLDWSGPLAVERTL